MNPRGEPTSREFRTFYREHYGLVWRTARRLGTPNSRLDDIVQEVFLVAHRRIDTFGGRSSMKTWLYGVTANIVRADHRRHLRHERRVEAARLDPSPYQPRDEGRQHEMVDLLDRLLRRLDPKIRQTFILIELEDVAAAEVAEALGLSVNTIHSRLRLAREQLHREVRRARAQQQRVG